MKRAALLLAGGLGTRAEAHSFQAGSESYAAFVEGAAVPVNDPNVLICLVATGLALGVWRARGLLAVWPGFIAGVVAGIALAPLASAGIGLGALGLGLAAAVAGVAAMRWPLALMFALSTGAGALAAMTCLQGHGWGALPVSLYAGVLFGAHLALVLPAGLVETSRRWGDRAWVGIGWRVAASWVGAVAMMLAALRLT